MMSGDGSPSSGEHEGFVPLIGVIEKVEGSIGEEPTRTLHIHAADLHESLAHGLIPHAVGEGRTVFPVLRRVTGSSAASLEMTHDHQEIARLTDELERLSEQLARAGRDIGYESELRRVLHRLRGVMERHFAAEEEACYQVLRTELAPEEAQELCQAMDRAAAEVRSLYE